MSDNSQIAELVEIYVSISSTNLDEHEQLAKKAFEILQKVFKPILSQANSPIVLPYKDISDLMFANNKEVKSNSIESFKERVEELILEFQAKPKHKTKGHRLKACHEKFVGHILLAQAQKEFMEKSAKDAKLIAKNAEQIASKAEELAKNAEELAGQANDIYKSMFANYVTILGVFTAIIVTIFGGLNVISVVAKQADTPLATIVFLTALALMCVLSLLYFLANILIRITQQGKAKLDCIFAVMMMVCVGAMIGAWCVLKAMGIY